MQHLAFLMPHLGLNIDGAVILKWLKAEGDALVEGEPVVQVETSKAVVDVEAPAAGNLVRIVLKEGDTVDAGALLGEIGTPAASTAPAPKPDAAPVERIRCTPAVRRRAEELGIALAGVVGTGPRGRIELRDLEAAAPATKPQRTLTPMRRAIARAMADSARTIPQFTVCREIFLEQCDRLKAALEPGLRDSGTRLSLTDCLFSAVARALLAHPDLNATFVGTPEDADAHIRSMTTVHVGIVVSVPDGIVVPVLHDVEKRSLVEIARLRADVVERARSGGLRPSELTGAVVSISNLGASGPDRFTALINPGQSAILAVGRRRDVAVSQNGQLAWRPAVELALTVDHRVTDGRGATDFLNTLASLLEHPGLENAA